MAEPGLRLIDRVAETAAAELTGAQGEAAARRLRRRGALAAGAAALLAVAATVFALGDPGPVAPPNDPGTGPPVDPGTGTALTGVRTPGRHRRPRRRERPRAAGSPAPRRPCPPGSTT